MKKIIFLTGLCIFPLLFFTGCATYYQKNQAFYQAFESGNIDNAEKIIEQSEKKVKPKDRLLYLLNRGVTTRMLGIFFFIYPGHQESRQQQELQCRGVGTSH